MDLTQRLKVAISEDLHIDPKRLEDLTLEAPLFGEGLGLDSLDALQLAVTVEERFGVAIQDEATGKKAFASLAALCQFITELSPNLVDQGAHS